MKQVEEFLHSCLEISDEVLISQVANAATIRTIPKGTHWARCGDDLPGVAFLIRGMFRFYFLDSEGREHVDCFCGEPGYPVMPAIDFNMPLPINVQALEESTVLVIPTKLVQSLMEDAEAASTVRKIYDLFLNGLGPTQIARVLESEKVLTPTAYNMNAGRRTFRKLAGSPYFWQPNSVANILDNAQYTGCTINFKSTKVSYKIHKRIFNDQEQWEVIPKTQEPIIDADTFQKVQRLRQNRHRCTKTGRSSLFSNIVYCADCGSKLHFCTSRNRELYKEFFRCAQYKSGRGKCTSHYIRNVVLEQIVLENIRNLADFVKRYEPVFLFLMEKERSNLREKDHDQLRQKVVQAKKRIADLDALIQRIYEDNILGRISDERFFKLTASFESEQAELSKFVETHEEHLNAMEDHNEGLRKLLIGLRDCLAIKELTPTIVNTLVDRIEVHEAAIIDGRKNIRVDIFYSAVGLIRIPTDTEISKIIRELSE